MSNYQIISDSTADLSPELVEQWNIMIVPLRYTIEGKDYYNYPDGRDLSTADFYSALRSGKTSITSAINNYEFEMVFEPILKENRDILYLAFSSGLSSTYSAAVTTAKELEERYPEQRVICVDTRGASMGEGLLVHYAVNLQKNGATIDEVAKWVADHRLNLCHWFTVDDLMHLYRGGRDRKSTRLNSSH